MPSASGTGILVGCYLLLAITAVLLLARIYVALRITHIFDASDVTILIAMAFLIAQTIICQLAIDQGVGKRLADLSDPGHQILQLAKFEIFFSISNICTTLFTKYSISLYILRIKRDRYLKIVLGAMMFLMTAATIAALVVLLLTCVPLEKLWRPEVKGSCSPSSVAYIVYASYWQSGCTVVVDLGLTISPIVILWNVQIRRQRKVLIVSLMSLGLIATVSSAARNAFVFALLSPDITSTLPPVIALAALEAFAGLIAACIPTCVPLLTRRRTTPRPVTSTSQIYYSRSITTSTKPAAGIDRSSTYLCAAFGPDGETERSPKATGSSTSEVV